jgi:hypothetical protein
LSVIADTPGTDFSESALNIRQKATVSWIDLTDMCYMRRPESM